MPEWVSNDPKGYKSLNTRGLEALMVESLRTLKAENDALRDRVKALEDRRVVSSTSPGLLGLAMLGVLGGVFAFSRRQQKNREEAG